MSSTFLAERLVDTVISSSTSFVFIVTFIGSTRFSHSVSWKMLLPLACSFVRNRYT